MNVIRFYRKAFFAVLFLSLLSFQAFGQIEFITGILASDFNGAHNAFTADFDNDGDLDIVASAMFDNEVIWIENLGDNDFQNHLVSSSADGVAVVEAGDMDNDGDMDIVATEVDDDAITIWFNNGAENPVFTEFTLEDDFNGVKGLHLVDMDYDGDLDILVGGFYANRISWYENISNNATVWEEHMISNDFNYNANVFGADIDGDDDIDVLATVETGIKLWYNDGDFNFDSSEYFVAEGSRCVKVVDVNQDGLMDILGAATLENAIYYWEQQDNGSFERTTVVSGWGGAVYVNTADMDNDGDIDILGSAYTASQNAVFYNNGNEVFTMNVFDSSFEWSKYIEAADLDNDGDLDLIGAALHQDQVRFYTSLLDNGNNSHPVLSMNSCLGRPGYTLPIPVFLNDIEDCEDINSIEIALALPFDCISVIDVVPFEGSTIANDDWMHAWNVTNAGLEISSAGLTPVNTEGIIYIVNVEILANAPVGNTVPLIFEDALLNEGSPHVMVEDGEIFFSDVIYGDVSLNGSVQAYDAMMIMEYAVDGGDWSEEQLLAGDVSADGEITILDASLVLAYTVGNIDEFPAESGGFNLAGSAGIQLDETIQMNQADEVNIPISLVNTFNVQSVQLKCEFNRNYFEVISANNGIDDILSNVEDTDYGCIINVAFADQITDDNFDLHLDLGILDSFNNLLFTITDIRVNEGEYIETGAQTEIINSLSTGNNTELPLTHGLVNVYPNPFNPQTTATVELTQTARVKIDIYNTLGQRIATIADGQMQAGRSSYVWNAKDYPSGIYLMNVQVDNNSNIRKITLLK